MLKINLLREAITKISKFSNHKSLRIRPIVWPLIGIKSKPILYKKHLTIN